jgi:hypothetical protein
VPLEARGVSGVSGEDEGAEHRAADNRGNDGEVLRRAGEPFTRTAADSPYDGQCGTLAAYGFCAL